MPDTFDATLVRAPASKSLSHRALIAAALAGGESIVKGLLHSDDLEVTRLCLAAMGAVFIPAVGGLEVEGMWGRPTGGDRLSTVLDMHESGTSCRLLTAVAAAGTGLFEIRGTGRMHSRPLAELVQALTTQSAEVEWLEKDGYPPLRLKARGLTGGPVQVSLEESSQYLSGLLLAAPMAASPTMIHLVGSKAVSWPYVGLTLQVMEEAGISFRVEELREDGWKHVPWREPRQAVPGRIRFTVMPGHYQARTYTVEGDWSNASYLLAAGAIGPRPVAVAGLNPASAQGDRAIMDILQAMGARIGEGNDGREPIIAVGRGRLRGGRFDMGSCPDLVPTVAVLAALAEGETEIRNVAHLRIKESDRLAAMAMELSRLGTDVDVLDDGLRILPAPVAAGREIEFSAHADHRIAMSLSLLTLAGIKVRLDNPGCVAKSFPGFWDEWGRITQAAQG